MKKSETMLTALIAGAFAVTANAWTIRPGLQQAQGYLTLGTQNPETMKAFRPDFEFMFAESSIPLEVVPGAVMADVESTESYGFAKCNYTSPYSGALYHWDFGEAAGRGYTELMYYGYRGEVYLIGGKTYAFGKRFNDYVKIEIGDTVVLENNNQNDFATATFVPETTGWYPVKVIVMVNTDIAGNDGNVWERKGPYEHGIGTSGAFASQSWGANCGYGLAWNDAGYTEDYANENGEWSPVRTSADLPLQYVNEDEDIILLQGAGKTEDGYRIELKVIGAESGTITIGASTEAKDLSADGAFTGWDVVAENVAVGADGLAVAEFEWTGATAPYIAAIFEGTDGKGPSVVAGSRTFSTGSDLARTVSVASMVRAKGDSPSKIILSFNEIDPDVTNTLSVAWGSEVGGDKLSSWENYKTIAQIPGNVTTYEFTDFPASWGRTAVVLRFFINDGTELPYWKELAYVQGNGSGATLNTGYVPTASSRVQLTHTYECGFYDGRQTDFPDNNFMFCADGTFAYRQMLDDLNGAATFAGLSYTSHNTHYVTNDYEFGTAFLYDRQAGKLVAGQGYDYKKYTAPIMLLSASHRGRILSVKIREGGTIGQDDGDLIADMIPVIDWSGNVGLYDTVRKMMVKNVAQSGIVEAGPVVAVADGNNCIAGVSTVVAYDDVSPKPNADYRHYFDLTVEGYTGTSTLANFPVLVTFEEGRNGFSYADMKSEDGADLYFTDLFGNPLAFEIDCWDTNGVSSVWVGIPELVNKTTIRCYYGRRVQASASSGKVWRDAGYIGVWHMNGADSTDVEDATGNGFTAAVVQGTGGDPIAGYIVSTDGMIGKARDTGYHRAGGVTCGVHLLVPDYDAKLTNPQNFTISGWFNAFGMYGNERLFSRKDVNTDDYGFEVNYCNGDSTSIVVDGSGYWGASGNPLFTNPTVPSIIDTWRNVTISFEGNWVSTYFDGSLINLAGLSAVKPKPGEVKNGLAIGCNVAGNEWTFSGKYDEIRLRNAVSSADWVKAEYDAAHDPDFVEMGVVRSVPGDGLIFIIR